MSLKETVSGQVDRARVFVDRLRARYIDAYARALELSGDRLDDLARLSETLGPSVRDAVDTRIHGLRNHLDELNRSLADKAIPVDRKAKVDRMALNEKARRAGQNLRLVKGDEVAESPKSVVPARESAASGAGEKQAAKPARAKRAAKPSESTTAKPKKAAPKAGPAGKRAERPAKAATRARGGRQASGKAAEASGKGVAAPARKKASRAPRKPPENK